MPTALALSPHLDDAAFSCGGTLAALADAGWRVLLCTIFTASVPGPRGFALACQLDKGLAPNVDYMALRRAEDAAAADILGATPRWLSFPEAPHRGYGSAPELFAGVRPDDTVDDALCEALRDLCATARPDVVLAPQAVGGHVDHIQVVRALRRARLATPVMFWRDFPYAVRGTLIEPFAREFGALATRSAALTAPQRERKRCSCLAYASQIGFQFGGPDQLTAALDTVESFLCEPSAALPLGL